MAERRRKTEEAKNDFMVIESCKITRTHEFDNGNISFDAIINGVQLYRLTVVKPEDSKKGEFIGYPSYQSNGKWYNYFWMHLSDDDIDKIIQMVYDALDE